MFGVFTVNLPTNVYRFTPRHDTYTGNFLSMLWKMSEPQYRPNPKLEHLRGHNAVREGDKVLTSGDGGLLPRGLPVGVVVVTNTCPSPNRVSPC